MNLRHPPFFADLRSNDWAPSFHGRADAAKTADDINLPHEDYPDRVLATIKAIEDLNRRLELAGPGTIPPSSDLARQAHRTIFPDHGARAGQWRQVNVRVGNHLAPHWELVEGLMQQLDAAYQDMEVNRENLCHWYFDFETIHPFVDGNGRSGGVVVAAIYRSLSGIYLTPGQ